MKKTPIVPTRRRCSWLTLAADFRVIAGQSLAVVCLLAAGACSLSADSLSFTGTLANPDGVFETTFTLTGSDTVTFQTWGFGGGTNATGQVIPAGGFDPLIALFTGSGPTAAIVTDGSGNPLADADNLLNPPWSFVGNCPPAGTVAIGTDNDCGDDFMQAALGAGTYTLVLTDANYVPNAVYDNGALSEGFTDFTGGVFQTCDPVSNACITPDGNYAVDIVSTQADLTATPEPSALPLLAIGLMALGSWKQFRKRRMPPNTKGAAQ
ncbi:MAG TPA: DVUA0089 family protein [Bryobacteraceae bacterium]|nr:DVUA0089 family protein [Bryobacteraceae bacterium]